MKQLHKLYQKIYCTKIQRGWRFQNLLPAGLSLLLLLVLIWDEFLPFAGYRWLRTIGLLSSIGVMLQQQHHAQQLKKQQAQIELLHRNAIADLELAMTQREQIQHDLAHKAILLQSFLDASPDLLYYCNEDQKIFDCNRIMELLTSSSRQQIIGRTPIRLFSETVGQKEDETNRQLFQTNRLITYEVWTPKWQAYFEVHKVPFYDPIKKQRGLLAFGRDITARKKLQLALEKANHSKTHFIATISHELRTPLSGIIGLCRLLREEQFDQPLQQRYLKTIYLSALTLNHIRDCRSFC